MTRQLNIIEEIENVEKKGETSEFRVQLVPQRFELCFFS